jgi:hypothetical protein
LHTIFFHLYLNSVLIKFGLFNAHPFFCHVSKLTAVPNHLQIHPLDPTLHRLL